MENSAKSEPRVKRIEALFGPLGALVAGRDESLFLSAAMAPAQFRDDLMVLYAFKTEITRVPFMVSEPMLGEIRLQWWREVLDQAYSGGPVRAYEVSTPLAALIAQHGLKRAPFETFLEALGPFLGDEPAPDLETLADQVAGIEQPILELAGAIAGTEIDAAPAAQMIGLTHLAMSLPRHAAQGRNVLPLDLLRETEADPHALFRGDYDARMAKAFGLLLHAAETRRQNLPRIEKSARGALLPAALAATHLKEMASKDFNPFAHAPTAPRFKQQWAAWRFNRTGKV